MGRATNVLLEVRRNPGEHLIPCHLDILSKLEFAIGLHKFEKVCHVISAHLVHVSPHVLVSCGALGEFRCGVERLVQVILVETKGLNTNAFQNVLSNNVMYNI